MSDAQQTSLNAVPFYFIKNCDPVQLLNILQKELPQTVAVILSCMEPDKASIILQNLPGEMACEVFRRIATLGTVDSVFIDEIKRVLESKLSVADSSVYAAGGVAGSVEILNLLDRDSEQKIIEYLEENDPELAEEIKKRLFVFDDIVMLNDRAIQRVLREVDSLDLAKALKGAGAEVQKKIFNNVSKRAAAMIKEDMHYMGPVRLSEVEETRQKIVSVIRYLEETGEIIVVRAGKDVLVTGEPIEE